MASENSSQPKSADEFKSERITWFGLVAILIVAGALPDSLSLHKGLLPLLAGIVLIFSGIYQYRRQWRVSFSTWVGGTLLLVMAGFGFVSRPDLDLSVAVVVIAIVIIALGIFTRET